MMGLIYDSELDRSTRDTVISFTDCLCNGSSTDISFMDYYAAVKDRSFLYLNGEHDEIFELASSQWVI